MVILSVSDIVRPALYSKTTPQRFADVDLVIGCGDLPYYYLEFIADALNAPVMYVHGNHDALKEYRDDGTRSAPMGAVNVHRRVMMHEGIIFAGLEGSMRYRDGKYMYTDRQMWLMVFLMVPKLIWNRLLHGRFIDILVTHSPPAGIHDRADLPHQGFSAIHWLIQTFRPRIHVHGHIRLMHGDAIEAMLGKTRIINTYGYQRIEFEREQQGKKADE